MRTRPSASPSFLDKEPNPKPTFLKSDNISEYAE